MSDIADTASTYQDRHNAQALADHQAKVAASPLDSASECAECGLGISSEHQIAAPGCDMCADCATWWEHVAERRRMGLA